MWRVTKVFIFFSIFNTTQGFYRGEDFGQLVKANKIESKRVDNRRSYVYIDAREYEIFFYDTDNSTEKKFHENTVIKLYTSVNCEFAKLTRDELLKFVRVFPVFKHSENDSFLFVIQIKEVMDRLNRLANTTDRYVDVLFNATEAMGSPSVDQSFLVALLGTRFKLDYMQNLHKHNERVHELLSGFGVDTKIVQTALKSINDVETFMSLNCGVATFYDVKTADPGPEDECDETESGRFLRDLRPLGLESSNGDRCSLDRMLLRSVLGDDEFNVLRGTVYVELLIGCDVRVRLEDVFDEVRTTHESEVIYWYQKFVLEITVSLMCDKMLRFLSNHEADDEIPMTVRGPLKTINTVLFSEPVGLPADKIVDVFEWFGSKTKLTPAEIESATERIAFYSKLSRTFVKIDHEPYSERNPDQATGTKFTDLVGSTLENYLAAVVANIDDYKCFARLYALLDREFRAYYAPFVVNYGKIADFVADSDFCDADRPPSGGAVPAGDRERKPFGMPQKARVMTQLQRFFGTAKMTKVFYKHESDDETTTVEIDGTKNPTKALLAARGCEYVRDLIRNCSKFVRKYDADAANLTSFPHAFYVAFSKLREIGRALSEVEKNYPNHYFQKIAYQLSSYFEILGDRFTDGSTIADSLVRIVSLMVDVFNYYGLEYCHPPEYDFDGASGTSAHSGSAADTEYRFGDKLDAFLSTVYSTKHLELLLGDGQNSFTGLTGLYEAFESYSETHDVHRTVVVFEWNGTRKTAGEIYAHIVSTLVRPTWFYAFFDVVFKFYLATIFYETNVFYKNNKHVVQDADGCESFKNVSEKILKNDKFPNQLKTIVKHLDKYLISVQKDICGDGRYEIDVRDMEKTINKTFNKHGVFVESENGTDNGVSGNEAETRMPQTIPERDGKSSAVEMISRTGVQSFYSDLERTINEVLDSVESIKVILKNMIIYT